MWETKVKQVVHYHYYFRKSLTWNPSRRKKWHKKRQMQIETLLWMVKHMNDKVCTNHLCENVARPTSWPLKQRKSQNEKNCMWFNLMFGVCCEIVKIKSQIIFSFKKQGVQRTCAMPQTRSYRAAGNYINKTILSLALSSRWSLGRAANQQL